MTQTRGPWVRPLAALVALILTSAGVLACLPNAHATGRVTILRLNDPSPGAETVSGVFTDSDSVPLVNFVLNVSIDGRNTGTIVTGPSGNFSFAVPSDLDPGTHLIGAEWPGDAQYLRSQHTVNLYTFQVGKAQTTLTATADPATAYPGATITVSGMLTSSTGQGINSARVTVTLSWEGQEQMTITGEEGGFDTVLSIPSKRDFPSSLEVFVEYKGDNVYEGSSATANLELKSTPTPTPSASSANTATPTPTASTSAAPTVAPTTQPGSSSQTRQGSAGLGLALVITVTVAVAAICALVSIAIISNRRHRLAADERRGFGSDFGLKQRQ